MHYKKLNAKIYLVGDNNEEEIPVPMPNTEVKLFSAEDTCGLPYWENRKSPVFLYSSLAQLVEHAAVNRRVVSSSLTRGAKMCDSASQ